MQESDEIVRNLEWSNGEKLRSKDRENAVLRDELNRMKFSQEGALEALRRHLTDTFERHSQEQDQAHTAKEREVRSEIHALSMRCEHIVAENSSLSEKLAEANRRSELLMAEMAAKEELRRLLQGQLDDERTQKLQLEDALQRRVQQLQLEAATQKEVAAAEKSEGSRAQDKVPSYMLCTAHMTFFQLLKDLARERELRGQQERRAEEQLLVFEHDRRSLQAQMLELRQHENMSQDEMSALRDERDCALNRASSLRLELEESEARARRSAKETELLRGEVQAEKNRVGESDQTLLKLAQEFQQFRDKVREEESRSLLHATEQILENRNSAHEEAARLKEQHKTELADLRQLHQHELKTLGDELRGKIVEGEVRLAAKSSELDQLSGRVAQMRREAEEERTEAAALRLRLGLKDKEIAGLRRDGARRGGDMSALSHEDEDYFRGGGGDDPPDSPAFSQDMGPASMMSLPNSPMLRFGTNHSEGFRASARSGPPSSSARSLHELQQRCEEASNERDRTLLRNKELQSESERLKEDVRKVTFFAVASVLSDSVASDARRDGGAAGARPRAGDRHRRAQGQGRGTGGRARGGTVPQRPGRRPEKRALEGHGGALCASDQLYVFTVCGRCLSASCRTSVAACARSARSSWTSATRCRARTTT